jgi:signal transduction histidine kinase
VFKKLRNMFLVLNLLTTTAMMMVAFVAIYLITASDIHRGIENDLMRIAGIDRRPDGSVAEPPLGTVPADQSASRTTPPARRPLPPAPADPPLEVGSSLDGGGRPEWSVSFSLTLDDEGSVTNASSVFTADDDLYEEAAAAAFAHPKGFGQARLDGTQWAFVGLETPGGTRYTFVDVSARQAILTQLIYTFLIVAAAMLVVLFLISKFFADRAIRPIRDAFDKQKLFVADASHELRTPVAVISSNVDVVLANPDDRIRDHVKWLKYIKRESERMSKLTNDLLYLATVDHTEETSGYVEVDLSQTVESVVLSMEALFFEAGLTVTHDIAPGIGVIGNAARVGRVVVILLENALKYSDDRGTVTVRVTRNHNTVSLCVANPGEGIAHEHLDRIFDRFYRADAARSREQDSYGLGLAIARAIVLQHRGTISVSSEAGKQTTFRVDLPVCG